MTPGTPAAPQSPVLVTGGTGTLGTLVVERLRNAAAKSGCSVETLMKDAAASSSRPATWPPARGSMLR